MKEALNSSSTNFALCGNTIEILCVYLSVISAYSTELTNYATSWKARSRRFRSNTWKGNFRMTSYGNERMMPVLTCLLRDTELLGTQASSIASIRLIHQAHLGQVAPLLTVVRGLIKEGMSRKLNKTGKLKFTLGGIKYLGADTQSAVHRTTIQAY